MYGNYGRPKMAPIKEGEELDVRIEAVGDKGDGVAKVKGFVIFIPNTQAGDEVRIKVTKVLNSVSFGEVIGKAQGPVEVPEEKEARPERPQREVAQPAPHVDPEPAPEDTDDFGSELLEEEEKQE